MRDAFQRRVSCGSFAANGTFGTNGDDVWRMIVRIGVPVTRIAMGDEVFDYWKSAKKRYPNLVRFYAAEVFREHSIDVDTMRFFADAEFVGEMSGWTP
jgi:hypothetical protein